jgi:hypothetical protein
VVNETIPTSYPGTTSVRAKCSPCGFGLYRQLRVYTLDRALGTGFEDIYVLTAGAGWAF